MRLFNPRLRAQIIKELLSVLRDPRSRLMLIGPPLMQLLVFSFAATLDVSHVDLAVYNRDSGRAAHELIAQVAAADFVDELRIVHSPEAVQQLIDQRKAIAAIEIPEQFSRNVAAGRPAPVQVIIDGRRANAGQITLGYLNAIVPRVGATLASSSLQPARPASDRTSVRNWFNPNLNFRWYTVPSLSGILTTFITLLVTALSIARERELGTFDQLLVSPTTTLEIIIAKTVPAVIIGTVLGLVMIGAGAFVFRVPFHGSFLLLLGSLVLFILSMVGVGLMISSVSSTQQQAILGTFAVAVPTVLMSGFATPVENMPQVLQWIAEAIPLKHFLIIVQGSFMKALTPDQILAQVWPMAVTALVTLSGAVVFVRSKLQ
jgi:ABC-2 type transport system permease protein